MPCERRVQILTKRPTPRASGKRNFWMPSERNVPPTMRRIRSVERGAWVARLRQDRRHLLGRMTMVGSRLLYIMASRSRGARKRSRQWLWRRRLACFAVPYPFPRHHTCRKWRGILFSVRPQRNRPRLGFPLLASRRARDGQVTLATAHSKALAWRECCRLARTVQRDG